MRRPVEILALSLLVVSLAACHHNKVSNPIASVDSKQPDKVLFDRAMDALKHNKFDVARITLQTLINTYPDSEYIARAKLGVADSWYAEGSTAALTQAENEYKDFITFFPNMPESAEAQLKIGNIHFKQMEKPDRDFTHGKRAEEEYRQLILQYPDSKLVPEAKERLREVQEVLAEREYRIGRFYFLRESWAASIARLKSLTDTYPLYSQADDALYMLGNAYERELEAARALRMNETVKGKLVQHLTDEAAQAYSRIVARYPAMQRSDDAKKRLEALHRPVPTPTPEAIAQNKAEEASRTEPGRFGHVMQTFHKRPQFEQAAKVGEPTLVDPKPTNAPDLIKQVQTWTAPTGQPGTQAVTVETLKSGELPPGQSVPRSDAPAKSQDSNGIPELKPNAPEGSTPQASPPSQDPAAPPPQVNDAPPQNDSQPAQQSSDGSSSSSKKKKKGLFHWF